MRSRVALLAFFSLASSFLLPLIAEAAIIPFFGPIVPDCGATNTNALGWGAVVLVINNLILFSITLLIVFVAPLVIAWAGFLLVASSVNPEGKARARSILLNLVIGIVVALIAWLIVNLIMITLTTNNFGGKTWFQVVSSGGAPTCLDLTTKPSSQASTGTTLPNSPFVQNSGGGACAVIMSGPCSSSSMTIFGPQADNASQICNAESANGTLVVSTVDVIASPSPDAGKPVSFGLFQINISANPIGSLNCPSAFSARYTGSMRDIRITNPTLYDQCRAAALDPQTNINAAFAIYRAAGSSWRPWSTASRCGLAVAEFPLLAKVCEILDTV